MDQFSNFSSHQIPEELKRSAIDLKEIYKTQNKKNSSVDQNSNAITHRNNQVNQKRFPKYLPFNRTLMKILD